VCADRASRGPQLPLRRARALASSAQATLLFGGAATRFSLAVFRSYPAADKLGRCRQQTSLYACVMEKWLPYLLTYGAESFLRSCQLCRHSRTSQNFMALEGSSPFSQEPSTGPSPEPDRSSLYHPILSKFPFNIVHPSTSWSSDISSATVLSEPDFTYTYF
jgi:hypothetical protein